MSAGAVFLFLTRSCNLACRHCYVSAGPDVSGRMSLAVFGSAVDLFQSKGVTDFRLTGGEPTVHPRFDAFLERLFSSSGPPRLITNGIRLMRMGRPEKLLDQLSRCWISVYGLSQKSHQRMAGDDALPLASILDFVGRQTRLGHWVGVSAVIGHDGRDQLLEFLRLAREHGVTRLRFIFAEPSGTALRTGAVFGVDARQSNARSIVECLRSFRDNNGFDVLAINDPFDLSAAARPWRSCELAVRGMWSVSPDGSVYSCCFNVYETEHRVADLTTAQGLDGLARGGALAEAYAPKCRALQPGYWGNIAVPTCPIAALKPL